MSNKKEGIDFNLTKIARKGVEPVERPELSVEDSRHQQMMDAIAPFARKAQQKNMTTVDVQFASREETLYLVMCPEWAPEFPPFNLARLAGITREAGYKTTIMDLNVKAYNLYQTVWRHEMPFRLWDPSASWHWLGDTYFNDIHPLLEPLLEDSIQEIIQANPTVVGFSEYYISEMPTRWMAKQLRERAPHIKTVVGGSNVHKDWFDGSEVFDYVVAGEGEKAILWVLEDVAAGNTYEETKIIKQDEMERININGMPMPDYSGLDFNEYKVPNGVTSEFSRGCTAKCTFCEETHFWKYRQRQAIDVLKEAEWLYYNKGTDIMWFIDSLVNGNVNELRAFGLGLKAKQIPMKWTGYARCDGRMDEQYFQDIAGEGGCIMLNYGCESGSQKVLNDMAKGVTIKEMEENFRWGKKYGVYAATNWIVGFPTEEHDDFAKTMQFIWRNRDQNINNIGAGVGMAVGPATIVGQNPHKYNVSHHKYQNHWIRNDLTMGGTHVMHRVKLFYIFLDHLVGKTEIPFGYPVRNNLRKEHYTVQIANPKQHHEIEYEDYDYNIIKPDINPFADTLVNEIWPFLRMMWLCHGAFKTEILFNPEIDLKEFGSQYGPGMFNGIYKFEITEGGVWDADFSYKYEQVDNPYDHRQDERRGPFFAQEYSRMQSNAARRARKLAKPDWDVEEGRSNRQFVDLLDEERELNKLDFSFEYEFQGKGRFTREHFIEVPDEIGRGVNADNVSLNNKTEFIQLQDQISAVNIGDK